MKSCITDIFVLYLTVLISFCICDLYVGMFKKNDFLVAQDRLYKEKIPHRTVYAKYGRIFKCPITYFRIVDRLGIGRGPQVEIIRGGLGHKYLVLRIKSLYNKPISVNIYVGCENTMSARTLPHITTASTSSVGTTPSKSASESTSISSSKSTNGEIIPSDTTIVPGPNNNSTS